MNKTNGILKVIPKSIFKNYEPTTKRTELNDLVEKERSELFNQSIAIVYGVFILVITIVVMLELKTEYQIDLFPEINTPFDDVYREIKNETNFNY
jgi:hypothetical protein